MSPSFWKNRVLIVDDDPVISAMIQQTLTNRGYECFLAANGVQGWQTAKSKRPDAVVSDLMIPSAHGFLLLRQIKSDPDLRGTPVIIMTATGDQQTRAEAVRLGAGAYFEKPFNLDELAKTLAQLLKGEPAPAQTRPPTPPTAVAGDEGMVLP